MIIVGDLHEGSLDLYGVKSGRLIPAVLDATTLHIELSEVVYLAP